MSNSLEKIKFKINKNFSTLILILLASLFIKILKKMKKFNKMQKQENKYGINRESILMISISSLQLAPTKPGSNFIKHHSNKKISAERTN